jgi:hypothetical protein
MNSSTFSVLPPKSLLLLKSLLEKGVRLFVFGGHAVRFHGGNRLTNDLDLAISPEIANIQRVCQALAKHGAHDENGILHHLSRTNAKLKWVGTELMTPFDLTKFDQLHHNIVFAEYSNLIIPVIAKNDLIQLKLEAIADPSRFQVKKAIDEVDLKVLQGCTSQMS